MPAKITHSHKKGLQQMRASHCFWTDFVVRGMEAESVWRHAFCTVSADEVTAARAAASSSAALRKASRLLPCRRRDVAADRVSGIRVGPACHAAGSESDAADSRAVLTADCRS